MLICPHFSKPTNVRFLSVSFFSVILTLRLTDKNCIIADNLYILPADSYSFSFSADSPIFWSAENNKGGYSSAAGVNLNITDKPQSATVGFVDYFLAS